MAARLEKTKGTPPGIFKRGSNYVVLYRDAHGRQRQESAPNLDAAKRLRTRRAASVDDGSYQPQTREKFATYASAWVERYRGNGRRGFTENTREEYRRDLQRYALPRLGNLRLEQITPRHIAEFVAWLCDERKQGEHDAEERRAALAEKRGVSMHTMKLDAKPRYLADSSVRRILTLCAPVSVLRPPRG
jgi:hypothetical protein